MVRFVVLDRKVVREPTEDPPVAVVSRMTVAHGDELRDGDADAGAGAVIDGEAVDHDVRRVLDIDAVRGRAIVSRDLHVRAGSDEGNRIAWGTGAAEVEPLV